MQLIFEAVSIQHITDTGEDVISLRRITDILSPFENQITDNLPVHKIFRYKNLEMIVKFFCMQEISAKERKRLVERKFVPQALLNKKGGEQLYDNIEKVIKNAAWKEIRDYNSVSPISRLHNNIEDKGDSTLTMTKIAHNRN